MATMCEEEAIDLDHLAKRIKAQKGVSTTKIKVARKAISVANPIFSLTASAVTDHESCKNAIKKVVDKVQGLYVKLMEHDEEGCFQESTHHGCFHIHINHIKGKDEELIITDEKTFL